MAETKETGMLERLRKVVLSASYVDDIDLTDDEADAIVLAVVFELREPSQAMVDAGRWPAEDEGPAACWKAMLDAAFSREVPHEPR